MNWCEPLHSTLHHRLYKCDTLKTGTARLSYHSRLEVCTAQVEFLVAQVIMSFSSSVEHERELKSVIKKLRALLTDAQNQLEKSRDQAGQKSQIRALETQVCKSILEPQWCIFVES